MRQIYYCKGHGNHAHLSGPSPEGAALIYIGTFLHSELKKNRKHYEIDVTDQRVTETRSIIVSLSDGASEPEATASAQNQIKGLFTGVEGSHCDATVHGNVIYEDVNHARIAELQWQNDKLWDAVKELLNKVEEMNLKTP